MNTVMANWVCRAVMNAVSAWQEVMWCVCLCVCVSACVCVWPLRKLSSQLTNVHITWSNSSEQQVRQLVAVVTVVLVVGRQTSLTSGGVSSETSVGGARDWLTGGCVPQVQWVIVPSLHRWKRTRRWWAQRRTDSRGRCHEQWTDSTDHSTEPSTDHNTQLIIIIIIYLPNAIKKTVKSHTVSLAWQPGRESALTEATKNNNKTVYTIHGIQQQLQRSINYNQRV